jgi:transglutaminase-like putative cysteine protease
LAETIEVKFTPAIQSKAAELGNNPVKIYNWVRNNIEFVPTYGSIQGADMCLQTKQCNDFDTASLLIALLRASGIYARYVYGTIELPIEKVKNWVGGFTDSMEALRLLASAKIPTKGMTVGGEIKYVRIESLWVEAWIDYIPSRGARHKVGDMWIPLDASFKQYNYTQGIDIKSAVPFDAQSFVDQITSTATIN